MLKASGFGPFFRYPGVARIIVPSLVARLPNGMVSLAIVLAVASATQSFADAGLAAAAYSVGSGVLGPFRARTAGRKGAVRVVVVASAAQGFLLIALALAALAVAPLPVLLLLAAATGAVLPPLNPVMRKLWTALLRDDKPAKGAASSFESIVLDVVFIAGPAAVSLVTLVAPAAVALFVAAVARVTGALGTFASPVARRELTAKPSEGGPKAHFLGPLRAGRVLAMMPVSLLAFGSIPAVEVAITAFTRHQDHPAGAGLLIGLLSVGGVAGGVIWGSCRRPGSNATQLVVVLCLLAVGWAALTLAGSVTVLALLLVPTGLVLSPVITAQYDTLEELVHEDETTEAFGWLNAMSAAGSAAGAALGGALSNGGGPRAFAMAAGMVAVAAAIVWAVVRRPARPPADPVAIEQCASSASAWSSGCGRHPAPKALPALKWPTTSKRPRRWRR